MRASRPNPPGPDVGSKGLLGLLGRAPERARSCLDRRNAGSRRLTGIDLCQGTPDAHARNSSLSTILARSPEMTTSTWTDHSA